MTTETLNVNHNLINNKRISRLQRVILQVLAEIPSDRCYYRRQLSYIVAKRYGTGLDTLADQRARLEKMAEENPDRAECASGVHERMLQSRRGHVERKEDGTLDQVGEWVTEKFAVSMSRSLTNLREQGLIRGLATIWLTEKGYEVAKQRGGDFHA